MWCKMFFPAITVSMGLMLIASACPPDPVATCEDPFVSEDGRLSFSKAQLGQVFAVRATPNLDRKFCAFPIATLTLPATSVTPTGDWNRRVVATWSIDGSIGYGDDFSLKVNSKLRDSLTVGLKEGEISRLSNYASALNSLEQPLIVEVEQRYLSNPYRDDVVFFVTDQIIAASHYSLLYEGKKSTSSSITVMEGAAEVVVQVSCDRVEVSDSATPVPLIFAGSFFEYDFADSRTFRAGLGMRTLRPTLKDLDFGCDP